MGFLNKNNNDMQTLGRGKIRINVAYNCPELDKIMDRSWIKLDEQRNTRVIMKYKFKGDLEKAFLDA
jgi:hypothetical protein